jgi:hypothetical protein
MVRCIGGIWAALAIVACAAQEAAEYKQSTLRFSNLPEIEAVVLKSRFYGYQSAVDRDYTAGHEAYDYSVNVIRDGDLYRLFSGGRWRTPGRGDGDHVLQYVSTTGAGGTWQPVREGPELYQGQEEGLPDTWFSNNYLEPEVVKVGGTYYLYTQVEVDPGQPIDLPGLKAETSCDRIQLHTSPDCLTWQRRSTERGVVTNLENPTRTSLHHQEIVYVPWDEDGRPFWLYVGAHIGGQWAGYSRIRSADPTTFDWSQREAGVGFSQLGNQTGYVREAPGGPLFVRITFAADDTGRQVPTLQFSRDGLAWFPGDNGPVLLDGSKDEEKNRNCYFLGLSTLDGTGQLERIGEQTCRAIYAASTCNGPGHPDIWFSEIGVGELQLSIVPAAE